MLLTVLSGLVGAGCLIKFLLLQLRVNTQKNSWFSVYPGLALLTVGFVIKGMVHTQEFINLPVTLSILGLFLMVLISSIWPISTLQLIRSNQNAISIYTTQQNRGGRAASVRKFNLRMVTSEYKLIFLGLTLFFVSLATTTNLWDFYLYFELVSVALFILWGFSLDLKQIQAATLYFLYSLVSTLYLTWGYLFLYVFSGFSLVLPNHLPLITASAVPVSPIYYYLGVNGFILAFAVKLGIFPYHNWVHYVYTSLAKPNLLLALVGVGVGYWLSFLNCLFCLQNLLLQLDLSRILWIMCIYSLGSTILGAYHLLTQTQIAGLLAGNTILTNGFVLLALTTLLQLSVRAQATPLIFHIILYLLVYAAGLVTLYEALQSSTLISTCDRLVSNGGKWSALYEKRTEYMSVSKNLNSGWWKLKARYVLDIGAVFLGIALPVLCWVAVLYWVIIPSFFAFELYGPFEIFVCCTYLPGYCLIWYGDKPYLGLKSLIRALRSPFKWCTNPKIRLRFDFLKNKFSWLAWLGWVCLTFQRNWMIWVEVATTFLGGVQTPQALRHVASTKSTQKTGRLPKRASLLTEVRPKNISYPEYALFGFLCVLLGFPPFLAFVLKFYLIIHMLIGGLLLPLVVTLIVSNTIVVAALCRVLTIVNLQVIRV